MTRDQLIIDLALYQRRFRAAILRAAGVRGAIIKGTSDEREDPMHDRHLEEAATEPELLPMDYHWLDPIGDPKKELDFKGEWLDRHPQILFCWLDCEQWWANWGSWYQAIQKKIEWAAVSRFAPQRISDNAQFIAEGLRKYGKKVGIYTSYGFVTGYARAMSKWIGQYPLWVAHYGRQPKAVTTLEWDQIGPWLPNYQLLLPPGADPEKVVGHQFTGDRLLLPGVYSDDAGTKRSPLDVSVFNKEFLNSLTNPAPVPVELSLEEKVEILWQQHLAQL